jgi:predicted secreted protein
MKLTFVSGILVFSVIWWIVFFMALPFNITRGDVRVSGCDEGAPDHPHLMKKMCITTCVSVMLFALYLVFVTLQ